MRRPAREFTRIVVVALAAAGCGSCPPEGLPEANAVERCGEEALRAGRPAEARALFLQAMRGQSRPFLAWIGVARASIDLGDLHSADLAIGQAMQIDPGSAASTDLVGRTLLLAAQARGEGGRAQALMADAILSRAERLDPKTPKIAYHRGLAHLAANDARGAVVLLERAAREEPADESVQAALALARERAGQPAPAASRPS